MEWTDRRCQEDLGLGRSEEQGSCPGASSRVDTSTWQADKPSNGWPQRGALTAHVQLSLCRAQLEPGCWVPESGYTTYTHLVRSPFEASDSGKKSKDEAQSLLLIDAIGIGMNRKPTPSICVCAG